MGSKVAIFVLGFGDLPFQSSNKQISQCAVLDIFKLFGAENCHIMYGRNVNLKKTAEMNGFLGEFTTAALASSIYHFVHDALSNTAKKNIDQIHFYFADILQPRIIKLVGHFSKIVEKEYGFSPVVFFHPVSTPNNGWFEEKLHFFGKVKKALWHLNEFFFHLLPQWVYSFFDAEGRWGI